MLVLTLFVLAISSCPEFASKVFPMHKRHMFLQVNLNFGLIVTFCTLNVLVVQLSMPGQMSLVEGRETTVGALKH